MFNEKWCQRRLTDSAQHILAQIPSRAHDRGLLAVDSECIAILALWSLLLWEHKVGLVAIERSGVDRFDLIRGLDRLLVEKSSENPVAYDKERNAFVFVKTQLAYDGWDFDDLLEPLLRQAEHEAKELGHEYVGSEHLVLAILQVAEPVLSAILRQHGVRYDQVKDSVVSLLVPSS
jgi:ATP-dependent Clp protease ATP-binding subunit ClpA